MRLLVGTKVYDQVVTQCLLLEAICEDPSFDKVRYHVSALAFVITFTLFERFDYCMCVPGEPAAQD